MLVAVVAIAAGYYQTTRQLDHQDKWRFHQERRDLYTRMLAAMIPMSRAASALQGLEQAEEQGEEVSPGQITAAKQRLSEAIDRVEPLMTEAVLIASAKVFDNAVGVTMAARLQLLGMPDETEAVHVNMDRFQVWVRLEIGPQLPRPRWWRRMWPGI
jgi:hypothetical protein